jgi:hypothetical protein
LKWSNIVLSKILENIALRFSDTELTDLSFDLGVSSTNQKLFRAVDYKSNENSERQAGRLLTGRAYSHLKYSFNTYNIVISADEFIDSVLLGTYKYEFLKAFWKAPFIYIAFMPADGNYWKDTDVPNYIRLTQPTGPFPISFLDDLEELKEVVFQLEAAEVN